MKSEPPKRAPSTCRRCGTQMQLRTPKFGVPYYACPTPHDPPVVTQAPRQLGYAIALERLTVGRVFPAVGPDAFDTDGVDPYGFVDRMVNRLTVTRESARDLERDRRVEETDYDSAGSDGQAALGEWSA